MPEHPTLSRRTAIKTGIVTAAVCIVGWDTSLALPQDSDEPISFNELYDYPPMLGRASSWGLPVVGHPANENDLIRLLNQNDVIPIYGAVHHEPTLYRYKHNDVWFDTGDGYVHSSEVVPVREVFNEPEEVKGNGFWGEISVPFTQQHWELKHLPQSRGRYRMVYGSVFRVVERAEDKDRGVWYRLHQEQDPEGIWWWVQARHVRRIHKSEFKPISSDVPPEAKRVTISIGKQLLTCTEYGVTVFSTRISTGGPSVDSSGKVYGFSTPVGEHHVLRKTPSRHMIGGPRNTPQFYNLPGVPWCTFFYGGGAAIHGTTWHNDFGRPRSHGCVNVTSDAAKWIYRWTTPYMRSDEQDRWLSHEEREHATQITVEY